MCKSCPQLKSKVVPLSQRVLLGRNRMSPYLPLLQERRGVVLANHLLDVH